MFLQKCVTLVPIYFLTNLFCKSYIRLQKYLNKANKLSLNIKKTNIIIFKTKRKKTGNIIVKINDTEIKHVESNKFLGIYIDSNLTWKAHINHIVNKVAKTTGILYKARHRLPSLSNTENPILFTNLPIS